MLSWYFDSLKVVWYLDAQYSTKASLATCFSASMGKLDGRDFMRLNFDMSRKFAG